MLKKITGAAITLCLMSGCASEENQQLLATYRQNCAVGQQTACQQAEQQEKINHDEAVSNGLKAVAIGVLLPLAIIADAEAENASAPRCWNPYVHRWVYC